MDTRDIRCFRLVYEERSINKAAHQIFITPQGLSRIIVKLENELQTQLFQRTANGTIPTESGHYFYTQSQELLYHLEDLKQKMQQLNHRQRTIRIGFACGSLNVLPLEQISHLTDYFPELQLQWDELENQEVTEKLLDSTLDAGFMIGTCSHTELTSTTIYTGKMNAIVYQGHPYYARDILSIQDLQEQPLISMNQKYSSYHNLIQRCSDFGFTPNIVISTMENSLIYRFCQEKSGIGIDADIHPEEELPADLRKIELHDAIPWKISLVCRKNTVNNEIISKLQDICRNLQSSVLRRTVIINTYLEGIYNTVIIKDIEERQSRKERAPSKRRVSNIALLKAIAKFLSNVVGSPVSVKSVTDYLISNGRKVSPNTVDNYIEALCESFVFYEVDRFDIMGKELLKTNKKYYIVDLGLRNFVLPKRKYDLGFSIENIVYFELLRREFRVNIGKFGENEVDFVARKNDEIKYFQVTADMTAESTFNRDEVFTSNQ